MGDSRFTTESGSDGSFQIPGGQIGARIAVQIDDPRYVSASSTGILSKDSSLTLTARPGATINGRLVYPDGTPAAGITVFTEADRPSTMNAYIHADTGADGSYTLTGLATGKVYIETAPQKPNSDWVSAAAQDIYVTEGGTTNVPDIVMSHGATITGRVADKDGHPISDVPVGCYGPHRPEAQSACIADVTDLFGRYTLRVAPGTSMVYLQDVPPGSLRSQQMKRVDVADGASATVDFEIAQGAKVDGVLVDQSGKPLPGVEIRFGKQNNWDAPAVLSGQDGSFHASGLESGKLIAIAGSGWDIVSGGEVVTDTADPFRIVLQRTPVATISGMVTSPNGAPIGNVDITAQIMPPMGVGVSTNVVAQTDASGRYTLADVPTGREIRLEIRKSGYSLKTGGVVSSTGKDRYLVSDAVLAATNGTLTAKVLDGQGNPAVGALVASPDVDVVHFVTTDSSGAFTLNNLMDGPIRVMAASGPSCGMLTEQPGTPVNISLGAARTPSAQSDDALARQVLSDVATASDKSNYYARTFLPATLAGVDPEGAYTLAEYVDGSHRQWACDAVISSVIGLNDTKQRAWVATKIDSLHGGPAKQSLQIQLGIQESNTDPEPARKAYHDAVKSIRKPDKAEWAGLARMIYYGTRIGAPDADRFFDLAVAKAKGEPSPNGAPDSLEDFARVVGPASTAVALRAVGLVPEDTLHTPRADILAQIACRMADDDPAQARDLLASSKPSPFAYGITAVKIVDKTAATDPDGALALARTITDSAHRAVALARVAAYRPAQERVKLYREAFGLAIYDPKGYILAPWIAAVAYSNDPVEGASLLAKARAQVDKPDQNGYERQTDLPYAFYSATVAPGESRMRIEIDFARSQARTQQTWSLVPCAMAMAAVDPTRALEIAKQIPGDAGFDAQRKIAQYLLSSQPVRDTLRFDRWSASDTWVPGTPTEW